MSRDTDQPTPLSTSGAKRRDGDPVRITSEFRCSPRVEQGDAGEVVLGGSLSVEDHSRDTATQGIGDRSRDAAMELDLVDVCELEPRSKVLGGGLLHAASPSDAPSARMS